MIAEIGVAFSSEAELECAAEVIRDDGYAVEVQAAFRRLFARCPADSEVAVEKFIRDVGRRAASGKGRIVSTPFTEGTAPLPGTAVTLGLSVQMPSGKSFVKGERTVIDGHRLHSDGRVSVSASTEDGRTLRATFREAFASREA